VARISEASFVDEIIAVDSLQAMDNLLSERRVLLGIHIQPDFSRHVMVGDTATVQVLLDGRRANANQVLQGYLQAIVADLSADILSSGLRGDPGILAAPRVEVRHRYNPNLHFRWFIVTSLCAMLTMMLTLVITSLSIARERELGTFEQVLVSPLNSIEIIVSKMVPGLMAGMFVSLLIVLLAVFGFGVPFSGSPLLLFASLALFMLSVVGLGLMISALCQTQQQAILGVFIGTIPMILISGFATPVENMPIWLQYCAELVPLKHVLIIIHGCFLKSWELSDVLTHAWPMALIALVTLTLAAVVVRRRLQ
jgi:ABC-2 type transport system permease protein